MLRKLFLILHFKTTHFQRTMQLKYVKYIEANNQFL
jgi:hypothetical protein